MTKILLTLTLSFALNKSGIGQVKNFIDQPYIEVSGYADTLVTPNLIFIKILISEKDSGIKFLLRNKKVK